MKLLGKLFSVCGLLTLVLTLASCEMGGGIGGGTNSEGIKFVTNSEDVIENMTNVKAGDVVTLPEPTKKGYLFAGWYETEDFSSKKLTKKYTYNESVTLYARWMPIAYTITIVDEKDVIEVKTYSYYYGDKIEIPTPTSDYFDFVGWVDEENKAVQLDTMPDSDMTIYPVWEGKDVVLTLDLQGGIAPEGFKATIDGIKSGDTVTLLNPTKAGHIFKGWYDGTTNSANKYTSNTPILESMTLYARYESLENFESEYKINYNLNEGTLPSGTKYTYQVGEKTTLAIPSRKGFEFVGWYESPILFGDTITEISEITIGEVTVYAKWREVKDQYTVTFVDYLGYTTEVKVNAGSKVQKQNHDNVEGLEITWYLGNQEFDFNTLINEDIRLQANWAVLSDKLETIVPSVFKDNVELNSVVVAQSKSFKTTWKSSDTYTITNAGITNPDRVDTLVNLTANFKYGSTTITHEFDVVVPKVILKDLSQGKPVFGYVYAGSHKGFTTTAIETLEVVNLAFGRVESDFTVGLQDVERYLMTINQIRKSGVRVVLSLGGGGASLIKWSNMAMTAESRMKFALSCLEVVQKYHLDGIDVDWEYPGFGEGTSVEVDSPNYTLLMATINKVLKEANPDYLVTAALPGGRYGIDRYQVSQVIGYMDYLHLMTYDFHDSQYAYHHTALYASKYTSNSSNVHDSVNLYLNRGVPLSKIVVGVAFYGRVYKLSGTPSGNGLGHPVTSSGDHMTYTEIYNFMKNNKGKYVTAYDSTANATAIYIPAENKLVSYDNASSIKAKCSYVWQRDLGGIMYWENGEDTTDILLGALKEGMKK